MDARVAFLTGASGYIGKKLLFRLANEGWLIHVLSRKSEAIKGVKVHAYDGSTESVVAALELAQPEVIFHLASLYITEHDTKDVLPLVNSNILLGTQILEGMVRSGSSRIVSAGTSWQQYNEFNSRPVNLYAATKQAFEDIASYYVDAYKISCITLRIYDTYGPDDWRPKLFNLLLSAAKTGKAIELSPGRQKLHLVHVDDIVSAFLIAADRIRLEESVNSHQVFGLPSSNPYSVIELVGIIEEVKGSSINVIWGGRPYRSREVMVPVISEEILSGWSESIDLKLGIKNILM